jgi:MFS family permease
MGRVLDILGGRRVIGISLVVLGVTTALLSFTFHFFFLVFMFGLVSSIALSGASTTNTGALLARWFRRRRATVMGLNTGGVSLGGLIMVPFAVYLIQAADWRWAWAAMGLIILVLAAPLALLVLRDDPGEMGLQPDGAPDPPERAQADTEARKKGPLEVEKWSESLHSPPFWQLSGALTVCGTTTAIISFHFIAFSADQGIPGSKAALIFGVMMFMNTIGSVSVGFLSDRFSAKNLLAATYFTRGLAYVILLTVPGEVGLWIFAVVAGTSWIATNPPTTTLTADIYGLRALGTIGGISFLFHQLGGASSILLAGILYDVTGSYTLPFAIAGSLLFPAAFAAFTIKERKYSVRYQTAASAAEAPG